MNILKKKHEIDVTKKDWGQTVRARIEEEEERIDLDEMEESLEPESVEIQDQTPESLITLL